MRVIKPTRACIECGYIEDDVVRLDADGVCPQCVEQGNPVLTEYNESYGVRERETVTGTLDVDIDVQMEAIRVLGLDADQVISVQMEAGSPVTYTRAAIPRRFQHPHARETEIPDALTRVAEALGLDPDNVIYVRVYKDKPVQYGEWVDFASCDCEHAVTWRRNVAQRD